MTHKVRATAGVLLVMANPGRAREVSATQVHPAEKRQPPVKRVWMIVLLGDPESGFAMSDGLVESGRGPLRLSA